MSVELSFTPPTENFPIGKFMFFAKLNYKIFDELKEEFKDQLKDGEFPMSDLHQMKAEEISIAGAPINEYALEISVPYGDYTVSIFQKEIEGGMAGGDGHELEPLNEKFLQYFKDDCIP